MNPPKIIKPCVRSFARQVARTSGDVNLSFVNCAPLKGVTKDDCFEVVENHAAEQGGRAVLGWAIWERPKVFIEAEFHMVWETPEGDWVDISPHQIEPPRILFLRDPNRRYQGRQVDNIRKALVKDKDLDRFLKLFSERHRLWNEGELADYHGTMNHRLTPKMIDLDHELKRLGEKIDRRYGPWTPPR